MTTQPVTDESKRDQAAELFQTDWQIYRKMVDNNFLFHREAYAALHEALPAAGGRSFSFLDIACGDAGASIGALAGTAIGRYHGIDLSPAALAPASSALPELGCPFTLQEGDFAAVLAARAEPVDYAWIGLSLHHFQAEGKLAVMRDIRRILDGDGALLIFENASPDGEDRAGWLARWDRQEPVWSAYTRAEWLRMRSHVHASDHPETDESWRSLAAAAGFASATELYRTPSDLFRLYAFR